jgi:hypothetical protein
MLLVLDPAHVSRLSSRIVREFLLEYYRELGVAAPSRDPDYRRIISHLRSRMVKTHCCFSLRVFGATPKVRTASDVRRVREAHHGVSPPTSA